METHVHAYLRFLPACAMSTGPGAQASGMVKCLVMYWQNHGRIWIMGNPASDGKWIALLQSDTGIANWDVKGAAGDRCFAFDYDASGCQDHLFVYRRTTGAVYIIKKTTHVAPPRPRLVVPPAGWKQQPSQCKYHIFSRKV